MNSFAETIKPALSGYAVRLQLAWHKRVSAMLVGFSGGREIR